MGIIWRDLRFSVRNFALTTTSKARVDWVKSFAAKLPAIIIVLTTISLWKHEMPL